MNPELTRPGTPLDREQMQRVLRESEARFRSVVNGASMVLWALDREGRFVFSEGRGLADLGMRPGDIVGHSVYEVFADYPQVVEDSRRALSGEEFTSITEVAGIVYEARYSTYHDEHDRFAGVIGVAVDITERRRAESRRATAEASYRAIFDLSNDAIFVHDLETGEIVDANRAACELHQRTLAELKGGGLSILSDGQPPYSPEEAREYMRRAAAGTPQRFEWLVRQASGERFWVEVDLRRVAIDGVDRLLASARDITQRKAAEAVLRRSHEELEQLVEERTSELAQTNMALEEEIADRERAEEELRRRSQELETIFVALPDLYFRLEADGTVAEYRSGPESTIFLPSEAYIGERIEDLLPDPAGKEVGAALAELGRTGEPARLEFTLPFDVGEREFEARLLPLRDGQAIMVVRDITDRKEAERRLRRSEEHFRRLIENSTDVATILDPWGINRYQSPSVTTVLGYSAEEMVGTSAFERIHPDDRDECREVLGWTMRNPGQTRAVEFRYRHKDGSWRVLEARARTILPDSAAEGMVINSRDITERKRYEEALQLAKEEAERANRAKSDFLSRMSHELRTPMNSILGFAQLLERKDLPADQRKGVEHILKAGRHLLNLINEVLEISRIEAGRQNLSLEPVAVAAVMREARALILPLATQWEINAEECTADPDLFVQADRQRLIQVLLNLLSNAVKYNRPRGRVSLSCEVAHEPGSPPRVRVGVHDTGPGIAPEARERLFVPFERLGAERTDVEGTGLGLALSRRLVEAMGGTLTLDSAPGKGSTFWVELPRVDSPLATVDAPDRQLDSGEREEARGPAATLLYIEDNLPNLVLIETILSDRPEITLLSAVQGQMGLYLAWEHRPDLILLDMHLPDMRGDEVLRRLRSDPRTADTPVVIISADATQGTLDRLMRSGAHAYLTKPLDVEEFLSTVDPILTAPRGGA